MVIKILSKIVDQIYKRIKVKTLLYENTKFNMVLMNMNKVV